VGKEKLRVIILLKNRSDRRYGHSCNKDFQHLHSNYQTVIGRAMTWMVDCNLSVELEYLMLQTFSTLTHSERQIHLKIIEFLTVIQGAVSTNTHQHRKHQEINRLKLWTFRICSPSNNNTSGEVTNLRMSMSANPRMSNPSNVTPHTQSPSPRDSAETLLQMMSRIHLRHRMRGLNSSSVH
jgi:hypothetical protein